MQLGQQLINLPVITIEGGREIGKVKDLYLDDNLKQVAALYLGSEGFINKSETFIRQADVATIGNDAILVKEASSLFDEAETPELNQWLDSWIRRDDLRGRQMNTPGGTKIGRLGDIILDSESAIAGFSLSEAFVRGTVADNMAVSRSAVVETGNGSDDNVMTIELAEAERANLQVVFEGMFGQPAVSPAGES
jgi:sporulation protein YlmC with PRC-barrel domain